MLRTIIDIHVVQTVPPSNVNRDDTGSPKTATYGGARRARVSSQAWKRATRTDFESRVDPSEFGVRTKRVVELLSTAISQHDPGLAEQADELAKKTINAAGITTKAPRKKKNEQDEPEESGYLLFLSNAQIIALAELAASSAHAGVEVTKADAKARAKQAHSVDVALFGRMVADDSDLNVDAACQVAHALSVHEVSTEFDYYTAVDDHKKADEEEDAGAGMIGTIEFNSSTLYRYATIDVDKLRGNLGDDKATARAVDAFTRSFITSMPTGKQNTFANRTLPDAILITARQTQPINLVGAFEKPVSAMGNTARSAAAVHELVEYAGEVQDTYGETPIAAWSAAVGARAVSLAEISTAGTLDETLSAVSELVAKRLAEQ